jgi:hypothetical protein
MGEPVSFLLGKTAKEETDMYTVYHARTDQKGSAMELDYNPRKRQTFLTVARQTGEKEFGWPTKADEKESENAVRIRLDIDDVARLADGLPRPQEAQKENGQLVVFNTLHDRNKGSEKEGSDTTSLKVVIGRDPLTRILYLNRKNAQLTKTSICLQKHEWRAVCIILNGIIERMALSPSIQQKTP